MIKIHDLEFEAFIDRDDIDDRVGEIGYELTRKFEFENPLFLGMLSGAFVFMADIIREFDGDCEVQFVKYYSYDGTKSTDSLNEVIGVDDSVKDRTVILIEDIVDSGKTLQKFLPQLYSKGPKHVEVVSLLTKPTAFQHDIQIDHVGFEIEDVFVVGYGLDYNGYGRNLQAIYKKR
ncbi:hypoxanthine phosphoribosyltransferase [Portibacter marinus]|uniref:hypoxanthine phosphoribosyltransferase n=1 Tax=Portibacter marinus TaxID=2898660 RepID=UPI001F1F3E4A|nr:hypoxanthine phosphoribosyltransferase [Portibacter marinus]